TAVAVDRSGALRRAAVDTLLARLAAPAREPFGRPFALPDLAGDTVTLARFAGTVTLVNFWASWCDPCREEFPHMAALYREFDRKDFAITAISDDVDQARMRGFVREFRPPFPILVGGGSPSAPGGRSSARSSPRATPTATRGSATRRCRARGACSTSPRRWSSCSPPRPSP